MKVNILFIVLTFVIILAVVMLSDCAVTAMLIIALLVNFAALAVKSGALTDDVISIVIKDEPVNLVKPAPMATVITVAAAEKLESGPAVKPGSIGAADSLDIYGRAYEQWNDQRRSYTESYSDPKPHVDTSASENSYGIDAANTLLWQRRTVDKQRSDGWASKDADYFAHHYADEFDIEENKPWWGKNES